MITVMQPLVGPQDARRAQGDSGDLRDRVAYVDFAGAGNVSTDMTTSLPGGMRTKTAPNSDHRSPLLDLVVGLLWRDRCEVADLASNVDRFILGSHPQSDIVVDDPHVSRAHCSLTRDGQALRIQDEGTRNGTFVDGVQVELGFLHPGSILALGRATGPALLAMSRVMVAALPTLRMLLGFKHSQPTYDFLRYASSRQTVALVAQPGSLETRLVEVMHRLSWRRGERLQILAEVPDSEHTQHELVDDVRDCTLGILADADTPALTEATRASLLESDRNIRLIVVAPTSAVALRVLGTDAFPAAHVLNVPKIQNRRGEIERIFDACLEQLGAAVRVADLSPHNADVLRSAAWSGLGDVWEVARWLYALSITTSIRKAATALSVPRTTLQGWMSRLDFTLPI